MPRSILSGRWIVAHAAVILVVGTCIGLGLWQLDRLEQRRAFNAQVRSGLEQPPGSLGTLAGDDVPGEGSAYRRVEGTGTYDPDRELLLYGRALDGAPGHHVLTPLLLGGDHAVLVNRGWVPFDLDRPPVEPARPPAGEVLVRGVLLPPERADPAERGLRVVRHADPAAIEEGLPYRLAPVVLLLQEQRPAQAGELPRATELPELGEGPHLSYAGQWFVFGAIGLIVYLVLLRRELGARPGRPPADPVPDREPSAAR